MKAESLAHDGKTTQNDLEAIRSTLRTQVSEILRVNLTQLSALRQDQVYDHVLNTPELLHECFQVFRAQPDLFKRVVMRPDKRPAGSDQDPLWCGRSVDDVVRLIIRASAKRYFRATLPPPPPPEPVRVPRVSPLRQTAIMLKLAKPPTMPLPVPPPLGAADELYGAFRGHLLYEWQAALIPHYAPLEPVTVSRLGSRILKFRDPAQLKILATEGVASDGRLPLLLDDASRLAGPDGGVDPHALKEAFEKMGLDAIFPKLAENGARRAVAIIANMEARIFQILTPALDNNLKLVAFFLFAALSRMGEKAFAQGLGPTGALWAIQKLAKHLETCRPWPRGLPALRDACERAMAFAIDLDSGMPAQNPVRSAAPAPKPAAAPVPSAADAARASRAPLKIPVRAR